MKIAISGEMCSGKTSIANLIKKKDDEFTKNTNFNINLFLGKF